MSMRALEVTSPATITNPVLVNVSQATREPLSSLMRASRMASETWSQSLSGWPSVTLSDVNKYSDIGDSLRGRVDSGTAQSPSVTPGSQRRRASFRLGWGACLAGADPRKLRLAVSGTVEIALSNVGQPKETR